MGNKIKEIDDYIANAKPFAQPIMNHLRQLVHQACPDVEEIIKWSSPHFDYKGSLCNTAGFKGHCQFGFWKGKLMKDPNNLLVGVGNTSSMANFNKITDLNDLPNDSIIIEYIKEAMQLNEDGAKPAPTKSSKKPKKELVIPPFFMDAISENQKALATFNNFSYSKQKEYVQWVVSAKQDTTREKRLATSVEQLSEGKSKNWKYEKC